ncbi:hypothetical protein V865_004832 [Kwoniella europaea PYCC6329]|uniref:Uncharacterized protein n=1 Tax=Kwoniella europaea PYCC6329 TaxID=1423913 RepID=A0AAX4KJY1_9TREE
MPKDDSGAGVRVSWTPELTLKLLKFIKKEKYYRQVFFPRSSTLPKDRHLYARAAMIEFFEKDEWMRDAERRKLAKWDAEERDWRPTPAWGNHISNPIDCRVKLLRQRMLDGYYEKKYQIADSWTCFDDIPGSSKRATFRKLHPYYFILKELCGTGRKNCRAEALELRDMPKADPGTSKRRKRSPSRFPSCSSSSSSASESGSESDDTASPSRPSAVNITPPSKRLKPSVPDASGATKAEVKVFANLAREPVHSPNQMLQQASAPRSAEELYLNSANNSRSEFQVLELAAPIHIDSDSDDESTSESSSVMILSSPPDHPFPMKRGSYIGLRSSARSNHLRGVHRDSSTSTSESTEANYPQVVASDLRREADSLLDAKIEPLPRRNEGERVLETLRLDEVSTDELWRVFKLKSNKLDERSAPLTGWWREKWHPKNHSGKKKSLMLVFTAMMEIGVEVLRRRFTTTARVSRFFDQFRIWIPTSCSEIAVVKDLRLLLERVGASVHYDINDFFNDPAPQAWRLEGRTISSDSGSKLEAKLRSIEGVSFNSFIDRMYSLTTDQVALLTELERELTSFAETCKIRPMLCLANTAIYVSSNVPVVIANALRTIASAEGGHIQVVESQWLRYDGQRIKIAVVTNKIQARCTPNRDRGQYRTPLGFMRFVEMLRTEFMASTVL